jgi:mono/diheme cytochrome c family protein
MRVARFASFVARLALGAMVAAPSLAAAQTPAATPRPAPATGNATAGKTLYYDYSCYACHGYSGETGARAFVGNRSPVLASEEAFIRFLRGRNTISPPTPSTSMPSYAASTLSDRQARDIYAYVRSFTSHAPPLEQIEVLTQILKAASRPTN